MYCGNANPHTILRNGKVIMSIVPWVGGCGLGGEDGGLEVTGAKPILLLNVVILQPLLVAIYITHALIHCARVYVI